MDSLKKIIHPHKSNHHAHDQGTDSTTKTHPENTLPSGRGNNVANPFNTPEHNLASTSRLVPTEHNHLGEQQHASHTAMAESNVTGTNRHTPTEGTPFGQHNDHRAAGVDTGVADTVEARMPAEEGNNFPGTNPRPAHDALGTGGGKGLKYPGGE